MPRPSVPPVLLPVRLVPLVAVALGIVALGIGGLGCARDEAPPSTTSTTTVAGSTTGSTPAGHGSGATQPPEPDAPLVLELEVESRVSCVGEADIEIPVTYETRNAVSVAILVDDEQVPGLLPTEGTTLVPLACDGASHVVVVTAIGADGRTGVESRAIATSTTPSGD